MAFVRSNHRPEREGDLDALFEREVDRVFGYVLSRCGSRAVAEDVTADAFAAASQAVAAGKVDQVTGAWLQTVAQRRLIDHWRRSASHRRAFDRLVANTGNQVTGDRSVDLGDGTGERVEEALASLPDRQRAALVLRYMDEFSTSEVASALGVSYKAAESLLSRARRSFEVAYGGVDVRGQ